MSITSYSQDPYHDDYLSGTPTPKDKNYLKILFKPGVSVQARELNQIQSILQNQIDTHGNHIFKRNTPILGGATQIDNNVYFIDVDVNTQLTDFYNTLESLKGVLVSNEAKITIPNSPSPNDVLSAFMPCPIDNICPIGFGKCPDGKLKLGPPLTPINENGFD